VSAVWPVTLPQALRVGFKATAPNVVIRTAMDAGPAKIRRRFSTNVYSVQGEVLMNGAQIATFLDFFLNTLAGGALPFQWTVPWNGHPVDFRFAKPPDLGALAPRASLAEPYAVPLSLEMLPWTEQLVPNPPPAPPPSPNGGDYQFNNGGAGGTAWNQEPDPLDPSLWLDGGGAVGIPGGDPSFGSAGSDGAASGIVIVNP
jgi:hypothetical protein